MALAKVIVLEADPSAARQLAFGFQREGIASAIVAAPSEPDAATLAKTLPLEGVQAIVIGGADLDVVTAVRGTTTAVPILYAGAATREAARAAGADEAVGKPTFLRDIVTIAKMLAATAPDRRDHVVGQLGELSNVFSVVRAISALGRSATLTLMRGLRRGEVRFFHGEVTSAELGLIHGQAAFHQLLLWTEARFDLRHEDIVRRQQIPLTTEELLDDAETFLAGIRESSGALSPSMVLEQDVARLHGLGKLIPTEVHGVLRMFDGHRVLADILEDSPYRVFETLRVAQLALTGGLLRIVQTQRPKATWRAVLAIDEWLVGDVERDGIVEQAAAELDSGPIGKDSASSSASMKAAASGKPNRKTRRNRKQRRANTPLPIAPSKTIAPPKANEIDWGALVPRAIGTEVGTLASVVPVAQASGEIQLPTRSLEREKLEALMDTGKRDKIFPSELAGGYEPKVVFDDGSDHEVVVDDPSAPGIAKPRTKSAEYRDEQQDRVRALVKKHTTERMIEAADRRVLEAKPTGGPSDNRAKLEDEIRVRREAEEAKAREPFEAKAREEATARAKAREEAEARARAEQLAAEEAADRAAEAAEAAAAQRETAAAAQREAEREASETARRVETQIKAANEAAAAKSLADAIKGAAKPPPEPVVEPEKNVALAAAATISTSEVPKVEPPAPTPKFDHGKGALDLVSALVSESKTEAVTVAETGMAKVVVQDTLRVTDQSKSTTEIHAIPVATVKEDSHPLAAVPLSALLNAPSMPAVIESPKPLPDDDVATNQFAKVDAPVASAESVPTLPVVKAAPASPESIPTLPVMKSPAATDLNLPPAVDPSPDSIPTLPVAKPAAVDDDATPKIAPVDPMPSKPIPAPNIATAETAPLRSKRDSKSRISRQTLEPLVKSDAATVAHDASAVATAATHAAPAISRTRTKTKPPANIATAAHDKEADQLRADAGRGAVEFSDAEEAFFRGGESQPIARVAPPVETFDDLDEGYQPVGFWDRLMGRKKPKKK